MVLLSVEPEPEQNGYPADRSDQPISSACRQQLKVSENKQSGDLPYGDGSIEKKNGLEL